MGEPDPLTWPEAVAIVGACFCLVLIVALVLAALLILLGATKPAARVTSHRDPKTTPTTTHPGETRTHGSEEA